MDAGFQFMAIRFQFNAMSMGKMKWILRRLSEMFLKPFATTRHDNQAHGYLVDTVRKSWYVRKQMECSRYITCVYL